MEVLKMTQIPYGMGVIILNELYSDVLFFAQDHENIRVGKRGAKNTYQLIPVDLALQYGFVKWISNL